MQCVKIKKKKKTVLFKLKTCGCQLPIHEACAGVIESGSPRLCSFTMPVSAGIMITGNVPLKPISNSSKFSAVVAAN